MDKALKKELKAKAHHLKPVVMLGQHGLTEAVLAAIDEALLTHELIKIKISCQDRKQRAEWIESICSASEAELIQSIGHTATIYRAHGETTCN